MTAAATAAGVARHTSTLTGLSLVVAAGLVEGAALGTAQAWALRSIAPKLRVRLFVAITVVVAGLGWTTASAPASLAGDSDRGAVGQPPLALILGAALALGLVMGSVLGAAQSFALRGTVRHPWRWVTISASAWPPAMAVMFVGASTPGEDSPVWSLALIGAVTGLAAGITLGAVSGVLLPSLTGTSMVSRLVLAVLASPRSVMLPRGILGLEVSGRTSGRSYRLPVQWAIAPGGLAIVPGHAEQKTWWRNLDRSSSVVQVLREGVWAPASARLLRTDDPTYAAVIAAYRTRWPRTKLEDGQPVVLVRLGGDRHNDPQAESRGDAPTPD
jgi:hypothetical protein